MFCFNRGYGERDKGGGRGQGGGDISLRNPTQTSFFKGGGAGSGGISLQTPLELLFLRQDIRMKPENTNYVCLQSTPMQVSLASNRYVGEPETLCRG